MFFAQKQWNGFVWMWVPDCCLIKPKETYQKTAVASLPAWDTSSSSYEFAQISVWCHSVGVQVLSGRDELSWWMLLCKWLRSVRCLAMRIVMKMGCFSTGTHLPVTRLQTRKHFIAYISTRGAAGWGIQRTIQMKKFLLQYVFYSIGEYYQQNYNDYDC